MIEAAVDTIVFHHACRGHNGLRTNVLDEGVTKRILRIAVDPDLAIVDEWKMTVGEDTVNVLITRWADCRGIRIVPVLGRISPALNKALRQAGFRDTIDRVLVKVALVSGDRIVVTEDSDFWDPSDTSRPGKIGDAGAVVAKLLSTKAGVTVLTLPALIGRLKRIAPAV